MLNQWASRWGVPPEALNELYRLWTAATMPSESSGAEGSEAAAQSKIRLEASRRGVPLWRNNTGACVDETGRMVRYGLLNDSRGLNDQIKSSDLVGINPDTGRFVAVECKAPGWTGPRNKREQAQKAFLNLINSYGGQAGFAAGPEDVERVLEI